MAGCSASVRCYLLSDLARLLLNNEFDDVKQLEGRLSCVSTIAPCVFWLAGGVDPSQWIGAEQFKHSDLDIIRGMMRRERSRSPAGQLSPVAQPRQVSMSQHVLRVGVCMCSQD